MGKVRKSRISAARREELMRIVDTWKAHGGHWPAPVAEITDFAIRKGLYNVTKRLRQLCQRDIAEAMRAQYITDDKGRPVKKLHTATFRKKDEDGKVKQQTLWDDIDTATKDFMEVAFQQCREQIVGDVRSLVYAVDYFNARHPKEQIRQPCLDFTDDMEESEMPDEYRPRPSEEEED